LQTEYRPRAVVLAPEAPYPLAGGGALRTASLLHGMARRYAVDVIVFRQQGHPNPAESLPPGLARVVATIDLPHHSRAPVARAARNLARLGRHVPPLIDRFAGFEREVAAAVAGEQYEIGIIEHSWCAAYLPVLAPVCRRTALDLHNIESVLHARCAACERGGVALAHRVFGRASRDFERRWFPRFDCLLAASETDAAIARSLAPSACVSVYPNALPWQPEPPRSGEHAIVFSGNMEYHPNISAVRFFRAEVWPRLRERWPALEWRLVGKNPAAVARFTADDPRIRTIGPVDDAVAELARAQVAVAPLTAGSGTRVKILEAWAAGVPVVATSIGAEGLPSAESNGLVVADGGEAFAQAVSRLLACEDLRRNLGHAARTLWEKEFTWEAAWRRLPL
jgi:glycosyltransferase involved in cell wall biosynthesis